MPTVAILGFIPLTTSVGNDYQVYIRGSITLQPPIIYSKYLDLRLKGRKAWRVKVENPHHQRKHVKFVILSMIKPFFVIP
ncbi:hypothetical protein AQUCO_01300726v1 [Aquilegia coerulea]|uniref:Uncharacterized protein n=1 Tax=Aquilegia coerulea TaxID=218851 RepID=A0A2G5E3Q8_AQUCA|nr:hypothetical protein AQUCO_01300726v1 [Aquilegia coerulea]